MARYKYDWTHEKFQRFIKENRGKGNGKLYRPWLQVYDISSRGRSSRILGWKTGRIHHLLTEAELLYFYLLEWDSACIDVREQYPLLGLFEMQHILDSRLLKRLYNTRSGVPYVITTTFLITYRDNLNGKDKLIARSVKDTSTFEKPIIQDLLECQRKYWEANDIEWGIVDPKQIPRKKAKNIEWLHPFYDLTKWGFNEHDSRKISSLFLEEFNAYEPLRDICQRFDEWGGFPKGTGMIIYKHLLAHKKIHVDIGSNIANTYLSVNQLTVNNWGD